MQQQELKNPDKKELIEYIESSIIEFGKKFINPKYSCCFFASEGDVKCYLYCLIARNNEFLQDLEYMTDDGEKIITWRLHSELNTFEKVNSRIGHFDIRIINPNEESKENLACIEIEWISDVQSSYKELKSNLDKLSSPNNEVENCYLLILNDNKGFTSADITVLIRLK